MKQQIIQHAHSLGLDAIGFAPPAPRSWAEYSAWLAQGYHGEMHYLARRAEERKDPCQLLPGAQSVILVAKNYRADNRKTPDSSPNPTGIIAQYSRGNDYHDVMKEKLQKISLFIHEETAEKHKTRIFVDSSPVMEIDLAAQTQLGWKGKNTVLVNPKLGQYFVLAGILTTLPLEPDTPHAPQCGTCTKCLDACPTHAFDAPYKLDARKCISYWTIEFKGIIPENIRPLLGTRIFGCDDCISVCPWNRFARFNETAYFAPRVEFQAPDLIEWMRMDQEGFRTRFKGTPIFRLKRKRLLRNVAIALGNLRDKRALPVLHKARDEEEELIRVHANWAIQEMSKVD